MWLRYRHNLSNWGRGWAGGRWEETSLTLCFPSSCQPCSFGAEFRCPVDFRQEILVQVIGKVELRGTIKVASTR